MQNFKDEVLHISAERLAVLMALISLVFCHILEKENLVRLTCCGFKDICVFCSREACS